MKEEEEIKKIQPVIQDIKKIDTDKTLTENIKEEILFKKKLFLKLFKIVIVLVLIALSMGIWLFKQNKSTRNFGDGSYENFSYYTEKVMNSLSSINFLSDKENQINNSDTSNENLGDVLEESSSMSKSKSDDWWLNSGGVAYFQEDEFSTNIGALSKNNSWRTTYAKSNSRDTDNGYFPQNIFRLVNRGKYKNLSQSVYFNIEKINLSESKYRNESNGVLLFNRYYDGDNLYYTGLRVDGHVVVKKKIDGEYFTMVEKKIFKDKDTYDKNDNPNLIPENAWIGIKSELENTEDDKVEIRVYADLGDGNWDLVAETKDSGDKYGKEPFLDKGYAGIRTDFMDVKFKNYVIEKK